jgi:putative PIG3 family NAD(P)H quinone oxidoreductase
MRAVVVSEPGGPEVLEVRDVPEPTPNADEVLIDVTATAVNRADLLQRQGNYPPPPGASSYLGLECSGTIAALGETVAGWNVGDPVCALLSGGGYAERVAVPVGQLLPVPAVVSLVDAAALPEATCTVWSMVFGTMAGRLQPGEPLLVHGGTSGIGTMAIQVADALGADPILCTVGGPDKAERCRELGADVVIDYRSEDFVEVVRAATGDGVDVILDIMGAAYLQRNVDALAYDGRLVVIGLQGGATAELNVGTLLAKRAAVHATTLRGRPAGQKAAICAAVAEGLWPLIDSGAVRPVVDSVIAMDKAAEAHRRVDSSQHMGKVLLTPPAR